MTHLQKHIKNKITKKESDSCEKNKLAKGYAIFKTVILSTKYIKMD